VVLQGKDVRPRARNTTISLIIPHTGAARHLLVQDKVELVSPVQTQAAGIMSTVLAVSHNFLTASQLPTSGILHWGRTVARADIIAALTELNFIYVH
jgi:hypothetical protein